MPALQSEQGFLIRCGAIVCACMHVHVCVWVGGSHKIPRHFLGTHEDKSRGKRDAACPAPRLASVEDQGLHEDALSAPRTFRRFPKILPSGPRESRAYTPSPPRHARPLPTGSHVLFKKAGLPTLTLSRILLKK